MKTQTCQFVSATELFEGQEVAWDAFVNNEPDCTWGDNARSLITPQVIVDTLSLAKMTVREDEENQINIVLERLKGLPEGVYVDLEN